MGPTLTQQLTSFFQGLQKKDLPQEVIEKGKILMADTLSAGIAGSRSMEVQAVFDIIMEAGGQEDSSLWGKGARVPCLSAALVNGTFAHALELDDTHRATYLHAGACVVPAAMAIGERLQVSGEELLCATIAGYETAIRIALSVSPEHRMRGFHTTATVGVFGAAMAACLLLKLDESRTVHALGLAGTQSSGLFQFLHDGSAAKRMHPGKSSQSGLLAALLAQKGFTGSPAILEGPYGFGKVMSDRFEGDTILNGLGSRWHILEVGIKPYSACRFCHGPIDGALQIRSQPEFQPSRIASVEVVGSKQLADQTGNPNPKTLVAAQLSTPFTVALALHTGGAMPQDVKNGLEDPEVRRLASKVVITVDPDLPATSREVRVTVRSFSGKLETVHVPLPTGEPENPISRELLLQKNLTLTTPIIGESAAGSLFSNIYSIDRIKDISLLLPNATADMKRPQSHP